MQDYYDLSIINKILKTFNIQDIVLSGIKNQNLINNILEYNENIVQINTNENNCINGNPLNILQNLKNYDAIFINDDSNWYTTYNELKIIKNTTKNFPIVFICNNKFPNKRRDSYSNPNTIPEDFRHEYTLKLPICYNDKKIIITDGLYHACEENTPKNGVSTAIEDFLEENSSIGTMNINFINEISILYSKSQINQKRISIIENNIKNEKISTVNLSDKLIENQMLFSYINKNRIYNENIIKIETEISEKNNIIDEYVSKIKSQNNEIAFKDTQISGFESNLSLKDSQIKDIESKLINRDRKINNLENKLEQLNNELNSTTYDMDNKGIKISYLESQLEQVNNELNILNKENNIKDSTINKLTAEIKEKDSQYTHHIDSLNKEINKKDQNLNDNKEGYMEHIEIKNNQIVSLKNNLYQKENTFAIKESKLKNQINITNKNIKEKDKQIKLQKKELNEKKDQIEDIKQQYRKELSKTDINKYCISCFKEEISNNHLEIEYLKKYTLLKRILNPIAYLYLILKPNQKERLLNIKLYQTLKDSNCFDIGFYLNNNKDLINSKWCKYFSPELHYVCKGFDEKRAFNKKYFNRTSKKDLLKYLLECDN